MKNFKMLFIMLVTVLFAVSCSWQEEEYFDPPFDDIVKSAISYDLEADWPTTFCGIIQYHELIGDQTTLMGSVAVANDGEFLYVKYNVDPGYLLIETHLELGDELPVNKKGNPVIGHFDYVTENYNGSEVVIHKISLDVLDDCFDVYAHAVVVCTDEFGEILLDGNGDFVCEETAWGAGGGDDLVFAVKGWFGDEVSSTWAITTGTLFNTSCEIWGKNFGYIDLDLENLPVTPYPLVPGGTAGEVGVKMNDANDGLIFTITGDAGATREAYLYIGSANDIYTYIGLNGCAKYRTFPYYAIGSEIIEVPLSELSLSSGENNYFTSTRWGFYFNYCLCE